MLADRFGMADGVNAVIEVAKDDPQPELPAAAEALAREVTLMGTYDQARESIAAWFDAGADSVQLVLPPGRPEDELAEILDVAASVASAGAPPVPAAGTSTKAA
jgi:alkanesulfonate monooxygenase SsuD/methylene tetrahydromethanopterin reductase-like flavin-dependent oxidoreductase (luciferase family)